MHEMSFKIEGKIVVQLFVFSYYLDIIKIEKLSFIRYLSSVGYQL